MRKGVLVLLLFFCSVAACSQQPPNKGVHTVDGVVPLYIDGAQSGTDAPLLSPDLIRQARTMTNLSDVLHLLGPAYVARNDPARIARWHFRDGGTLTPWPQGGEKLSDKISVYQSPNCEITIKICKDLVLGRTDLLAEAPPEKPQKDDPWGSLPTVGQSSQQPNTNPNQQSPMDRFEQGLSNIFLSTTNGLAQGWARSR